MKRLLSLSMILIVFFTLLGPCQTVNAATIKISKTSITITEGKTAILKVTGTTSKITWTSSNKSIATVSSKGVVTGKKAGKATITATVNKKKYSCTVTVKEAFNATKAIKNIEYVTTDTGSGLILQFKNNYTFPVNINVDVLYYDTNGTMIGKSTNGVSVFDTKSECALKFYGPYDANYASVPYDKYDIKLTADLVDDTFYKSNVKDISFTSNFGSDNVMVEVKNSGKHDAALVPVSIVYYKDNQVIGYDYTYADIPSNGSDYLQFSFPYDDEFNILYPTDYKIYVNESYYVVY